jgi:DNA transposition AAA+ family ATPase
MPFVEQSKEGEEALIARLRRFVEDSNLSFYQIASCVGISGTTLSMRLSGIARPDIAESAEIQRLLQGLR